MIEKIFGRLSRNGMIKAVGVVGILVNAVFAVVKLIIGTLSNSVAIMSDAVNNLSDATSSVITLVGLKLSQKPADRKHPLGYGRIEYLSSLVIAVIILIAGGEFFRTSFERIIHPEAVVFTTWQFAILGLTVIGKLFLSRLNVTVGKRANSLALQASGAEAMTDVLASIITIVTAMISQFTGLIIDGYVGLLLAMFIVYTGIKQLIETISSIIGERADKELVKEIYTNLKSYDQILGAYDFILHSYGPSTTVASINLEFSDTLSVKEAYEVMGKAQKELLKKHQIYFVFGLYSVNTYDGEVSQMYENISKILASIPTVISLHAFRVDKKDKVIHFDVVHDFTIKDIGKTKKKIQMEIFKVYPEYQVEINIDFDYA